MPASLHNVGGLLTEPRQDAPRVLPLPVPPSFPPMVPAYTTSAPAAAEVCILARSEGMDDLERRPQLAMVAYVGGSRPSVSCVDAAIAISEELNIPRHCFSVHKYHPEDFLIVFASRELRNRALASPSVEHQGFKLFIKPWLRQAQAKSRLMRV